MLEDVRLNIGIHLVFGPACCRFLTTHAHLTDYCLGDLAKTALLRQGYSIRA